ncbi:exosortase/archaeosortase family protein [Candidatus Bathyarchaeota archaeon]|nr:MAG: exosortase/archaeosortase family protein [Candidatus Bathyarchaeota archaeon]
MASIPRMKERPMVSHAMVQLTLSFILAAFLASGYAWDMIARASIRMLETVGIKVKYLSDLFLMYVRLLDGSVVGFQILLECSGLITLLIFAFISSFTIGLLGGSLLLKTAWFMFSASIAFLWNLLRLASVIAIAYNFGLEAFRLVHFVLAPTMDFIWVVSLWALGMSLIGRRRS